MSLSKNTKINNKWTIKKLLGEGEFGKVYSIKEKDEEKDLCIKICILSKNKDKKRIADSLYYEYIMINGHLKDFPMRPYTPDKFYGEDLKLSVRYLVMQKLDKTLKDYFLESDEEEDEEEEREEKIKNFGKQILKGLEWLHSKKILYIDIKPDNFMILEEKIFFIDFGLIVLNTPIFRSQYLKSKNIIANGTPTFLSLNVLNGGVPSYIDDVEALGYMLLFLVKNKLPWDDPESQEELIDIKTNKTKKYCIKRDVKWIWNIIKYCRNFDKEDGDEVEYGKIKKYM